MGCSSSKKDKEPEDPIVVAVRPNNKSSAPYRSESPHRQLSRSGSGSELKYRPNSPNRSNDALQHVPDSVSNRIESILRRASSVGMQQAASENSMSRSTEGNKYCQELGVLQRSTSLPLIEITPADDSTSQGGIPVGGESPAWQTSLHGSLQRSPPTPQYGRPLPSVSTDSFGLSVGSIGSAT